MRLPSLFVVFWKSLVDQLGGESARLADPAVVGPLAAGRLRVAIVVLAGLAVSSSITAAITAFFSPTRGAVLLVGGLMFLALYHAVPRLWRSLLASGIDKELPAVLVYLVPYSASPRYIADVIAGLPDGVFKWFRHESSRLRLLMDMGLDPLTALRRLAETTPSRRLREVLVEYTSLQLLGAQSSEASIRLLDRAVSLAREKWASFREIGRAVVELAASGLVSLVALAPLMGGATGPATIGMGVILVIAGITLLGFRPELGDAPRTPLGPAVFFGSTIAGSLLALQGRLQLAVLALLAGSVIGELLHYRVSRVFRGALRSLRVAAEKARLGLEYLSELEGASPLGAPVRAVIESSRIAGGIGVGQALLRLQRVVEEAAEQRSRAVSEAAVLEGVSMIAPLVMALAIGRLARLFQQTGPLLGGAGLLDAESVLALAPLAVVPAAILRRGWTASPLSGLAALILVLVFAF